MGLMMGLKCQAAFDRTIYLSSPNLHDERNYGKVGTYRYVLLTE